MFQSRWCFAQALAAGCRIPLLLFALAFWAALEAPAQINTGKIVGTVTDSRGAAISHAVVRAENQDTGVATTTETQDTGSYLINFLIPGRYTLEVQANGFEISVQKDLEVTAGNTAHLDATLQVGQVKQTIAVEANPVAVNTESAELSQTFGYKELDELPNLDRNPLYQMNLLPGANNGAASGNFGSNGGEDGSALGLTRPQLVSIGGISANVNNVYIEGIFNQEPQNGYVGVVPPIEDIQELQVFAGKYDAEYGFSGSAVINVVTKSGTDEFHGSAFEYLRNAVTDAANYFDPVTPPFHRNQFGGALGGPILKNKLFFFSDYQGTLVSSSIYEYTTAPTAQMYQGNFSALYSLTPPAGSSSATYNQIYNPFTRTFDQNGNVVSATPFAGNIIPASLFDPAAAKMNAAQIFGVANLPGLTNNLHYLSSNTQNVQAADARIDYDVTDKHRLFYRYSVLAATNGNLTNINQFFQDGNANSVTRNQNMQLSLLSTFSSSLANEARVGYNRTHVNTGTNATSQNWNNYFGIPNGNLGDSTTEGIFSTSLYSNFGAPAYVAFIVSNTVAATDNFTWVKGKHIIKVGLNLNHIEDTSADTIGSDDARGTLGFSSAMTSFNGNAPPFAYESFLLGTMTSSARARFVTGYPYQTYWQNAFYVQDDFKVSPSLTLNLGFRYELTTLPVERFNRQSNWDDATNELVVATSSNRSPAINPNRGDVGPRVGFAWSPDQGKTSLRAGYGISYYQATDIGPLTRLGASYPNYAKEVLVSANDLTPDLLLSTSGIPIAPPPTYDANGNLIIPPNTAIRGVDRNWRSPEVAQLSVNVQREIVRGVVADVGYLGVRSLHNPVGLNLNQALPQPPGANYTLAQPLNQEYPQLNSVSEYFSIGAGRYDALTARVTARPGHGFTLSASYAHGRNFANGTFLDQSNINQYYGPTAGDIAHIFSAQFSYEIPVGHGQKYLSHANRLVDAVLGGWRYSGFLTIQSGERTDIYASVSLLNNGQFNRPDRICNGNISNRTLTTWFDTSCFVNDLIPQTYGNAGVNPLITDGLQQLDSSLFKTFRITEGISMQIRTDAFNTFNHPNFAAPDTTVGDPSEGKVFSTSVNNRQMQFGARLFF
jgi:hypothetical protein